MASRQAQAAQWLDHVAHWRASGLSRAAYCTRERLSESALGYWVAKANRVEREVRTAPLTLVAGQPPWLGGTEGVQAGAVTLRSPEGWQLSFAQCPPARWLRELLEGACR